MLIETSNNVARTAKAEIHTDGFKGDYVVEKFDGISETTGDLIFVKRQWRLPSLDAAREAANRWVEHRATEAA